MDPATLAILLTSLISAGITLHQEGLAQLDDAARSNHYVNINDLSRGVQAALSQAASKGQTMLDNVANRLLKFDLIQNTPALQNAISRATSRLKKREQDLRNDIAMIEGLSIKEQIARDNANVGVDRKNQSSKLENYRKEVEDVQKDINKIEQRF